MTAPDFSSASALVNHLWQSTVVAVVVALLVLALRKNHARMRYYLWLAASMKFLLPFSLLIAAGIWLRSFIPAPAARPAVIRAMEQVTLPLPQPEFSAVVPSPAAAHQGSWLPILLLAIWACGAVFVAARFARGWWSVRTARRAARPLALAADVPVLSSQAMIEPGIFGFFRPVLLLPQGILERLSPEQLSAILAHEMCHVRWRDNFTYLAHMLVEALFWFYPPVWWIGKRLIEERERACDEAVIAAGGAAQAYADGILSVCKFCLESPLPCVSGVTGADLKQRIMRIVGPQAILRLSLSRKFLLAAAGCAVLAAPLVVGLACMGQNPAGSGDASAQSFRFAAVSIHPDPPDTHMNIHFMPDGLSIDGEPVDLIVQLAYGVQIDQISGLPAWAKTDHYSIRAKVDDTDQPRWKATKTWPPGEQYIPPLQWVLADRFNFKSHIEMQVHPVYCLVIDKHGPKFHEATPGDTYANGLKDPNGGPRGVHSASLGPGTWTMQGLKIRQMVDYLSNQNLGYPIEDQTGLTGDYDLTLHFASGNVPAPDSSEPSLFTALQEQLGLKLELKKVPIETIIVDHMDRPSPN